MLSFNEWSIIEYLKTEADKRSERASATDNFDESVLLRGEAVGIRAMVMDLLDQKHHKDARTD